MSNQSIKHSGHLAGHIALGKALDAYEAWLDSQLTAGAGSATETSGASLLHAIAEIRRHHCQGASHLMTSLLLDHTNLSSLVFEYQLQFVRGQTKAPPNSQEFGAIVTRQRKTLAAMRNACANGELTCLFASSGKGATRIPARPGALLADSGLRRA